MSRLDLASRLEVPVERVTAFIEGHEPISAEVALKLAQLFDRSARSFQPKETQESSITTPSPLSAALREQELP
jgi:plasmid maintenance system antidote protein VapI